MAVVSDTVSKQNDDNTVKNNENDVIFASPAPAPAPPKRNKSPGVRKVGNRVYDPVNGKTCHQCRQKTTQVCVGCKNKRRDKPCPIMICKKCLLNRYGEKAEEVDSLAEWSCPRCRGICNCSICMKKRGHHPTGILIKRAKQIGFGSVSDMLLKGEEKRNSNKAPVDMVTTEKEVIDSSKNLGKENSFDGKVDANLSNSIDPKSKKVEERPEKRKTKQECFSDINDNKSIGVPEETRQSALETESKKMKLDGSTETNLKNDKELSKDASGHGRKKKTKKIRNNGLEEKNEHNKQDDTFLQSDPSLHFTEEDPLETFENEGMSEEESDMANDKVDLYQQSTQVQFTLPMGKELTKVAGIDVPAEDVGNALQFLEFCAAFGKVLDVKKKQSELVLQDLFHGRTGRQGKFSVTVQFHILLLTVIQDEQGEVHSTLSPSCGKDSWFNMLKECLSESQSVLKAQGLEALDEIADYETLDASQKLRLLNLLCDEVLATEKVRKWMEEQKEENTEKGKETKRKLTAAKKEEKRLKKKMKDDIANAILAKGAPLTISEHEAIVSHIKSEIAEAHAKVLEAKAKKNANQPCDVLRRKSVLTASDGCVYWKLNASGTPGIICQSVGSGDTTTLDEKWSEVDDEGQAALEKHVCALRGKK